MSNGILDSDQSRELHELLGSLYEEQLAKKVLEKESAESEQVITEEPTAMEKAVDATRDHISKRNTNRLVEKNDLLAGPESVTSEQLQKSNQELWSRVQTALASLGGGGLGDQDVLDLIKKNPSYNFFTDSDYQRIADGLQSNFVHQQGDSMYGTLHLNHNDNSSASGNIAILKLDPPPGDSAYIGVFTQNDGDASEDTPSTLALRLHGWSEKQKFVIRRGTFGADSRGDVLEIDCTGHVEFKNSYTTNRSHFRTVERTVAVEGSGAAFVSKTGTNVITNSMRTWDSDFKLSHWAGGSIDLKMQVGTALTQFWNDQVRVHGALYVDDSGTFGDDLTVGGNISGSGDIDITGDLTCDDLDASNGQIDFLRVGQPGVPNSGTLIVEGSATINGEVSADSASLLQIGLSKATTDQSDPFFTFYEENGTHTLGVGWDLALLSKAENDIDKMALVTSENKILRLGYQNQNGQYEFPISVGTGNVASDQTARQRSTRVRFLAEPAASYDAVPLGYLTNTYNVGVRGDQIGDSAVRSALQATFASPVDSTDSSGGVGTFFFNTAANRLEIFKDSAWVSIRSTFDSDETLGIVSNVIDSDYVRARVRTDQDLRSTDDVTFQHIHMTHASGALSFEAKNETGGTVTKGTVVNITGVSGDVPTIGLADADGVGTMPAYGLVEEDANNNSATHVLTFGTIHNVDTSAFAVGDTLYVSTTPGELTNIPPAGSSAAIQNIGRVVRSHATAGSIKVGGAGRSNATPNLDAGYIFYGSDSNRSVATELTSVVDSNYVQTRIDASQLDFSGVPTSDPLTAGLVWRDSDNGNVLKVSVG